MPKTRERPYLIMSNLSLQNYTTNPRIHIRWETSEAPNRFCLLTTQKKLTILQTTVYKLKFSLKTSKSGSIIFKLFLESPEITIDEIVITNHQQTSTETLTSSLKLLAQHQKQLTTLRLEHCVNSSLTAEDQNHISSMIAGIISSRHHLQTLCLKNNDFNNESLTLIARAITDHPSLKKVYLPKKPKILSDELVQLLTINKVQILWFKRRGPYKKKPIPTTMTDAEPSHAEQEFDLEFESESKSSHPSESPAPECEEPCSKRLIFELQPNSQIEDYLGIFNVEETLDAPEYLRKDPPVTDITFRSAAHLQQALNWEEEIGLFVK